MIIKAKITVYHDQKDKMFTVEYFDPERGVRASSTQKDLEDARLIAGIEFKKRYGNSTLQTVDVEVNMPQVTEFEPQI